MIKCVGVLLLAVLTLGAQEQALSFKTTEVASGIYMLEGVGGFTGGNLGLLVGDDGVVLIDDGVPNVTDAMMAAIGEVTNAPVGFVINTHFHGDHVGGNEALAKKGTTVVAHDNIRKRLVEKGIMTPNGYVQASKDTLPELTFSEAVTFHLNGHETYVFHVEHAHTDGDAVIYFRDVNVIHTGDAMFNGLFPFIDLDSAGSLDGYINAQKKIHEMADDQTKIIPGHGPLASKADLAAAIDMLVDAKARVKTMVDAGKSLDEILAANPLQVYHDQWNWGFITTERMTRQVHRGITGQ